MEDFGAESIKKILEKKRLNVNEFLKIAISLSEILGQLHQMNIIHKNINSTNIVWNQETDQVKIIDFGISTVFHKKLRPYRIRMSSKGHLVTSRRNRQEG